MESRSPEPRDSSAKATRRVSALPRTRSVPIFGAPIGDPGLKNPLPPLRAVTPPSEALKVAHAQIESFVEAEMAAFREHLERGVQIALDNQHRLRDREVGNIPRLSSLSAIQFMLMNYLADTLKCGKRCIIAQSTVFGEETSPGII